jgi:hypothetical protein
LRQGARTGRHHRRFGDLAGAPRPGGKVPTAAITGLGVDVITQPLRIAREWAAAVAESRWDDAMSLNAADAPVHAGGVPHLGRSAVRSLLEGGHPAASRSAPWISAVPTVMCASPGAGIARSPHEPRLSGTTILEAADQLDGRRGRGTVRLVCGLSP